MITLFYLERQCIEAYLLDEKIIEKFFEKYEIIPGQDFTDAWGCYNLKEEKNTKHTVSDKMVDLIRMEIYPKKELKKNEIYFELAEVLREHSDELPVYTELKNCIFKE